MSAPSASTPPRARPPLAPLALAFVWGFAEATFFFIVPDVFLTRLALSDVRRALLGAVAATVGALLGASLLWWLALHDIGPVLRLIDRLPGISLGLVIATGQAVQENGASALWLGAVSGQPYKLFVAHAAAQGLDFTVFLLTSCAALLVRFSATTLLAAAAARFVASPGRRVQLHLWFWVAFYTVYFWRMR